MQLSSVHLVDNYMHFVWTVSRTWSVIQRSYYDPMWLEGERSYSDAIREVHRPGSHHGEGDDLVFVRLYSRCDLSLVLIMPTMDGWPG